MNQDIRFLIFLAASFAYAGYALANIMPYLTDVWKMEMTHAAAIKNIHEGSVGILTIVISFTIDSFVGTFWMFLLSNLAYGIGLGSLWLSIPRTISQDPVSFSTVQSTFLYTGIIFVALGQSGYITSIIDFIYKEIQAKEDADDGDKYVIPLVQAVVSMLPSLIEFGINKPSWSRLFGLPAITMVVTSILLVLIFFTECGGDLFEERPGSPLTRVARVFVVAIFKTRLSRPRDYHSIGNSPELGLTEGLRWLETALETTDANERRLCTITEVEEAKTSLRMVPMWLPFIICGVVSGIGHSYFLEQANSVNNKLGHLTVPLSFWLLLIQLSNILGNLCYMGIRCTKVNPKYNPPVGVGTGMFVSILCCIFAASMEEKNSRKYNLVDMPNQSMFRLFPQFVLFGLFKGFVSAGMDGFYEKQIPNSMGSYIRSFTEAIAGAGTVLSALAVYALGKASENQGRPDWFRESLNNARLENYYWTLSVMSTANLAFYILAAITYKYK